MAANESEKIFTKSFFLIFGALLFTALVMYALMSTVTEYATAMGSTATIAGLVSGIYVFGGLCSRIYSGDALERIGWRKIALVFMSIHFLACLLYFIVDNVTLLIIVRFVHGIGFGASANAIVTIASAILPKNRQSFQRNVFQKPSVTSCLELQLQWDWGLSSEDSCMILPVQQDVL